MVHTSREAAQAAGRKGGLRLKELKGPEYFKELAKKGGDAVKEKRGMAFFKEIGKKGGRPIHKKIVDSISQAEPREEKKSSPKPKREEKKFSPKPRQRSVAPLRRNRKGLKSFGPVDLKRERS